jgi:seryl-tRNA synthetase
MQIIKTETPGIVRDLNSKAILCTDDQAREEYRRRIQEKQMIQSQINTLRDNVDQLKNDLKQEISDLKNIILRAISEKGNV